MCWSPSFMSPIIITSNADDVASNIRTLPDYVDRQLYDLVSDVVDFGQRRMREIVPRDKNRLADAVSVDGPSIIAPGHYRADVHVNPFLAPHANYVDKGTGVDGPKGRPVRSGGKVMRFLSRYAGDKGGHVFRRIVKIHPSSKIEHGKNFSGRTYESMVAWTRIRVTAMTTRFALHIASRR